MARSLSTQAVLLSAATALGQLILVLTLAAVGRSLGPAGLGVVSVSMAVAFALGGVIDFGANSLWVRELSAGRLSEKEYRLRSGAKLTLGIIVAALITFVCLWVQPLEDYWGVGPLLASFTASQTLQVGVRAEQKNVHLSVVTLIDRVALVIAYLVMTVLASVDSRSAFYFAYLLGGSVNAYLSWLVVSSGFRPKIGSFAIRRAWRGGQYYGISGILVNAQSLDTVVAAAVGGQAVAGSYGAVNRWTQPIGLAVNAFAGLLAPIVAQSPSATDAWRRIRGSAWLPAASIGLAAVTALIADPLVTTLMGDAFSDSVPVLRVLCLAAAVSAASRPLYTILQARGRDKTVAYSMGIAIGVQLLIVGPLAVWRGALGVALAVLVMQFLLFVFLFICVLKTRWGKLAVGRLKDRFRSAFSALFRPQISGSRWDEGPGGSCESNHM